MTRLSWMSLILIGYASLAGCGDLQIGKPKRIAVQTDHRTEALNKHASLTHDIADPGRDYAGKKVKRKPFTQAEAVLREGATAVNVSGGSSRTASYGGSSRTESTAIRKLTAVIRQSLDVGPTLVVWHIDQTESAEQSATSLLRSTKSIYSDDVLAKAGQEGQLLTAIIGFGESTQILLDPPSGDAAKIEEAFAAVKTSSDARENVFGAVRQSLDKYLPMRREERREVLFVVLTDEPGDDATTVDQTAASAEKALIPIYVLGPSAPLGRAAPPAANSFMNEPKKSAKDTITYAADVMKNDLIPLESMTRGFQASTDVQDSGFGPWALERLARASGGAYYVTASGSATSGFYGSQPDPAAMAEYAPEYVSLAEYERRNAENRCRKAVLAAAAMEPAKGMSNPQTDFPKLAEAQMKRMLDKAQLDAARVEPQINKLFDLLAASDVEADRANLSGKRWQAAYDTAIGRACAMKVRVDGYNGMLAALKRGKTFANADSKAWVLEQADVIETGSAVQKLADKARMYLERVKKEHPGTPWAKMAENELATPLGWKWNER